MCLIVLAHQIRKDSPLWLAANRDELRSRPSEPVQLLARRPNRWGGKDLRAGGTWLCSSEHGLVVGLTNQSGGNRNPTLRSRGELPLLLGAHRSAEEAALAAAQLDPSLYNAAALLFADGKRAYYGELWGEKTRVRELPPGLYVLENRPIDATSPKTEKVRQNLEGLRSWTEDRVLAQLESVIADPSLPPTATSGRPAGMDAACVDLGDYGTRSATIVNLGVAGPRIWFADGPPGTVELREFKK